VRIRDDGWQEWLEPTPYHASDHPDDRQHQVEVEPTVAPARSPWARPCCP
jgi:hypothetical protein